MQIAVSIHRDFYVLASASGTSFSPPRGAAFFLLGHYRNHTNNRERTELENPDFGRIFELRSARTELLSKSELTSGHSIEW